MLALLIQRWDEVAPWLVEPLFADESNLGAFRALADADGDVHKAIEQADPEVRDLLERLSVADVDADSRVEVRNLVGAACRRELDILRSERDLSRNAELVATRRLLEDARRPRSRLGGRGAVATLADGTPGGAPGGEWVTDPQTEHVAAPLLERAEAERAVMERTSVTPPMLPPIDQIAPAGVGGAPR